jgi:ribosomal protein S18 acetylase RimI-like enzyme
MDQIIIRDRITIRFAKNIDRRQLANLVHFSPWVHRHLDWRPPLDWIGYQPYLVAERDNQLIAALTCPPDPPEVAWIRLFAASNELPVDQAWNLLWKTAKRYLKAVRVVALPFQDWFINRLRSSNFLHTHDVAMLLWENQSLPPESVVPGCILRMMNFDDLDQIQELDSIAFRPIWQQSIDMLRMAFEQAAIATVAETPDGIIGYQISTAGPGGGHLARLAVHPQVQGEGIGYALTRDLLAQFHRRGSLQVTVNTQYENEASLALYKKSGFRLTGEVFPVFETLLK